MNPTAAKTVNKNCKFPATASVPADGRTCDEISRLYFARVVFIVSGVCNVQSTEHRDGDFGLPRAKPGVLGPQGWMKWIWCAIIGAETESIAVRSGMCRLDSWHDRLLELAELDGSPHVCSRREAGKKILDIYVFVNKWG